MDTLHSDYSYKGTEQGYNTFENRGGVATVEIDENLSESDSKHYLEQISSTHNSGWSIPIRINAGVREGKPNLLGRWNGDRVELWKAANDHTKNETIHHEIAHAVFDSWTELVEDDDDLDRLKAKFNRQVDKIEEPRDLTGYYAKFAREKNPSRFTEAMAALAQIERSPTPEMKAKWGNLRTTYKSLTDTYLEARSKLG